MEQVNDLGISLLECIQFWCSGFSGYLEFVNLVSNSVFALDIIFPFVSAVDSVFSAQLLLCLSFGGWLNSILKWWLLEDRPNKWVREAAFYGKGKGRRPRLLQTSQTVNIGPGCPSGHTFTASSVTMLMIMWISHVMTDYQWEPWWWKNASSVIFAFVLCSVTLARTYASTHFPHQCFLGALLGVLVTPALCIYVIDPFIWRYGTHVSMPIKDAMFWHVLAAVVAIFSSTLIYFALKLFGVDPQCYLESACGMCEDSSKCELTGSPLFSMTKSSASMLGWALTVTPSVGEYRHNTQNRSLVIAIFATTILMLLLRKVAESVLAEHRCLYYLMHFLINVLRPFLFIILVPQLATWPCGDVPANGKKKR